MSSFEIAKLIRLRFHFVCEMCGITKVGKLFKYKAYSYVPRYKPAAVEICEDCIYKEVYSSKNWRKKKKEGALES